MKTWTLLAPLCAMLVVAGCSKPASDTKPAVGETPATPPGQPAQAVTDAPPAAPEPAPAPAADAVPAPTPDGAATPAAEAPASDDARLQALIGTKWKFEDFDIHFKDAETVHLNGGPLTMITAGKGLDATYQYEDGAITITAMGQTKTGTWDGEKLVVDGTTVERLETPAEETADAPQAQ